MGGIEIHPSITQLHPDAVLESPCVLSVGLALSKFVDLGAFSYTQGGVWDFVSVGRYCSFATEISIGGHEHPTSWLSSSPFQYNPKMHGWDRVGPVPYGPERPRRHFKGLRQTMIGNDVWIGHRSIIRTGINIGDGAIVGAGSVVTRDVPPYAIVAGAPAKLIRFRFGDWTIRRLQALSWWRYAAWDLRDLDFADVEGTIDQIAERRARGGLAPWAPPRRSAAEIKAFTNLGPTIDEAKRFFGLAISDEAPESQAADSA